MAWVWPGGRDKDVPPSCWAGKLTSAHTGQNRTAFAQRNGRLVSAAFVTNRPSVATLEDLARGAQELHALTL